MLRTINLPKELLKKIEKSGSPSLKKIMYPEFCDYNEEVIIENLLYLEKERYIILKTKIDSEKKINVELVECLTSSGYDYLEEIKNET